MANPVMTPSAPKITPVLCSQVAPVGAVLVIGPVIIVTVVPIVDSEREPASGGLGSAMIAVGAAMAAKSSELI